MGLRWPRIWMLLVLLIPLFLISKRRIIHGRLQDAIVSCGNHSGFWRFVEIDADQPLPDSTDFADFLSLQAEEASGMRDPLPGLRCPGYRRVGNDTGVVFVGGGLRLSPLSEQEVLIAFCSWKSH